MNGTPADPRAALPRSANRKIRYRALQSAFYGCARLFIAGGKSRTGSPQKLHLSRSATAKLAHTHRIAEISDIPWPIIPMPYARLSRRRSRCIRLVFWCRFAITSSSAGVSIIECAVRPMTLMTGGFTKIRTDLGYLRSCTELGNAGWAPSRHVRLAIIKTPACAREALLQIGNCLCRGANSAQHDSSSRD